MSSVERGLLNGSGYEVWMHRREREYCDDVDPVYVEIIGDEHVVWARRSGISENGFFDMFHIGCDHLGSVPRGESELKAMLGCEAVQHYLFSAASETADEIFSINKIIPHLVEEGHTQLRLDEKGEILAKNFIFEALVKTIEEPEKCRGNIRSGVHVKPILKFMLGGIEDDQLDMIIDELAINGPVIHEDPLVAIAA